MQGWPSAAVSDAVSGGEPSDEELRRAIELPARRVGLRVESALTDVLVTEVADQPGAGDPHAVVTHRAEAVGEAATRRLV